MEAKIEAGLISNLISPLDVGSTQVYKQKVKHLLYEHQNNITTLKADGELALKLQQDEFRVNEGGLGKDKRNLKQELKEQELANQDTVRSLKLEHSKEITKLRQEFELQAKELQQKYEVSYCGQRVANAFMPSDKVIGHNQCSWSRPSLPMNRTLAITVEE